MRIGELRNGRRVLLAPSGREVGSVRLDTGPAILGDLTLEEVRERLGPGDRFDDPERPNRNRCFRGHYYDEIRSGGCPWCEEG